MPRTIDSILASHHAATERRDAGQPVWEHTLDLSDLRVDTMPFPEWRDTVVARIKAHRWYTGRAADGFDEFGELIEALSETGDLTAFGEVFDEVYDRADTDRVWVKTR